MPTSVDNNGKRPWTEYFRLLTPVLLLSLNLLAGMIIAEIGDLKYRISELDNKVFQHLTNDELHSTRSQTVSLSEYDGRVKEIDSCLLRIGEDLKYIREFLNNRSVYKVR